MKPLLKWESAGALSSATNKASTQAGAHACRCILDMMRAGVSMRTTRRHWLDDPRLTDEVRAVLMEAAKARQSKAWFRRSEEQRKQDRLAALIRLGSRCQ